MKEYKNKSDEWVLMESVPASLSEVEVLNILQRQEVNWRYLDALKKSMGLQDEQLSDWLNISVRTLRKYRMSGSVLKENLREHLLQLISLFNHGVELFDGADQFIRWLDTPNFFFDQMPPASFLNKSSGIRYVEDRLTAMEYGDNV